jgi:uncharacterized membrane protein YhhN
MTIKARSFNARSVCVSLDLAFSALGDGFLAHSNTGRPSDIGKSTMISDLMNNVVWSWLRETFVGFDVDDVILLKPQ